MFRQAVNGLKSRLWPTGESQPDSPEFLQRRRILESGLFDPAFYLRSNPSLSGDVAFLINHYVDSGGSEGLQAHPLFDASWYRERYPDVRKARINPLFHYLEYGWREGRIPHPLFDPVHYQSQCDDIQGWSRSPLEHFLLHGVVRGLDPNPWFSVSYYRERYSQQVGNQNPLVHYCAEGAVLGCDPHPLFISDYYRDANQDVSSAGINPLRHFLWHGLKEGRDTNPLFDVSWYTEMFPGQLEAYGDAFEHYRVNGIEARQDPSLAVSTAKYLELHGSLDCSPVEHLLQRLEQERDRTGNWCAPLRFWLRDIHRHELDLVRAGPVISVIIPCYNQGRWLEDALLSVYRATRCPVDIILVDDGSTEKETLRLLPELAERYQARLITQKNSGLSGARNTGLAHARGEFVQFLDSDDLLLGGKIDQQLALGAADISISDYFLCNAWCGDWRLLIPSTVKGFPFTRESFLRNWERGLSIPIHCGLFSRRILEGFSFDRTLEAKEDWLMWIALSGRDASVTFLDRPAILYRQHSHNMGRDSLRMGAAYLRAAFQVATQEGPQEFFDFALKHFTEVYGNQIHREARQS